MKNKKLNNGFELPVLGFGTFGLGGNFEANYNNDEKAIKIIQNAIDLGLNHIDTAEIYGAGHTEELIGQAIKKYNRKKIFITSKVDSKNLRYNDVINSAKNSLKRLQTNYLDLYLIHKPNPKIPIKETMKALDYLIKLGIVKNIGVSSFNLKELKEAQKYTKNKIVANELKYNFWAKFIDLKTIKYCQENHILVIAYKVFGRGQFEINKIHLLGELARKYNKTEAQIILNWLSVKKNIVTIFKTSKLKNLKKNLYSLKFVILREDLDKIDSLLNSQKQKQ